MECLVPPAQHSSLEQLVDEVDVSGRQAGKKIPAEDMGIYRGQGDQMGLWENAVY
jgi:hypothetical protein